MTVETHANSPRREPRSALDLRDAMRLVAPSRRQNPPGDVIFAVSCKLPDAGDEWVTLVEGLADLDAAIDEARGAGLWKLPAGTALRVHSVSDPWWVGVVDDKGDARDAPPLPKGLDLAEDWVSAWEGPWASAEWMLGQCGRVDQRAVVAACLACVTPFMGEIDVRLGGSPLDRRPKEALRWLAKWREGSGDPQTTREVLAGFRNELRTIANDIRRSGDSTREEIMDQTLTRAMDRMDEANRRFFVLAALSSTCECAIAERATDMVFQASDVASDIAALVRLKIKPEARSQNRRAADRSLAPRVRSVISVGEVMASRFRRGVKTWRARGPR